MRYRHSDSTGTSIRPLPGGLVLFGWNTGDVDRAREANAYPHPHSPQMVFSFLSGTSGRSPVLDAQAVNGAASLCGKGGHRYSWSC
jgi:hypothetical protein